MKILGLDTSAKTASVSITSDENVVGEYSITANSTHSQTIMLMIDSLLKNTNNSLDDIDLFAINTGPGSFTGLRIGISIIKAFAVSKKKPCISISGLEALAYNCSSSSHDIICAVMDARREHVYSAIFQAENNIIHRISEDSLIPLEILCNNLSCFTQNIVLVGDGAKLCYNRFALLDEKKYNLASSNNCLQRASSVCLLAFSKYKNNTDIISASEIVPKYLILPQAERERLEKIANHI